MWFTFQVCYGALVVLYAIYVIWAIVHDAEQALALIVMTSLVVTYALYAVIKHMYGETIYKHTVNPISYWCALHWHKIKW